ncbi:UvrD-helicase domain-containing protein [Candidatus Nitrotoga arctica]|uniref:UvrD-helicase domain-containing protein n=1 Tax=Candidatus Nitrotoga arctica TaxID=453162 RepID=UPI0023BABE45|nr:ATP-dependent helicase [Candidatus Nitrotoga arctica]
MAIRSEIIPVLKGYEQKKRERHYLDYDDILSFVAQRIRESPKVCQWVSKQYDHLLVDEMQDTNPLQWSLLSLLKENCCLFCVGDDAQSIYGFRGADFKNIHSFQERVPGSAVLKLTKNYCSTQEILDVANWLLLKSPLDYGKNLNAARGAGQLPQLHSFTNEWEESRWITEDILRRREDGDNWRYDSCTLYI